MELKEALNNLWNVVGTVEGCTSKTGTISTYLNAQQAVVAGPYGYGQLNLTDELPIEDWLQIPAAETKKVLDALSGDYVLDVADNKITFRAGRFRAIVPSMGTTGPEKVNTQEENPVEVSSVWQILLTVSEFASMPNASSMPELTNIYWGPEGIWACNRISMMNHTLEALDSPLLILRSALMGLSKMAEIPTHVSDRPDSLLWTFPSGSVITPKILGEYPIENLMKIFDREILYHWSCNHGELKSAADRAGSLADEVLLQFKAGKLFIRTTENVESQSIVAGKWQGESCDSALKMSIAELKRFLSFSNEVNWAMNESVLYQEGENCRSASSLTIVKD